jgi:hypothetical protein
MMYVEKRVDVVLYAVCLAQVIDMASIQDLEAAFPNR